MEAKQNTAQIKLGLQCTVKPRKTASFRSVGIQLTEEALVFREYKTVSFNADVNTGGKSSKLLS